MKYDDFIKQIEKAIGHTNFPMSITRDAELNVTAVTYEDSWKTGGTTTELDSKGNVIYVPSYKEHKLTATQKKSLDDLISSIL